MELLLSRFYINIVLILCKYSYKNTPETISSAITNTYLCQTRVSTKDDRQWAKGVLIYSFRMGEECEIAYTNFN